MPEGVDVDVEDGEATVVFTDRKLRAAGLRALLDAAGPGKVRSVTLPRRGYVVSEAAAREAGLLDGSFLADTSRSAPQGYGDGKPDMDWSRKAIDAYAAKAGVEEPESLPNKQAVLDAISEITSGAGAVTAAADDGNQDQ